KINHYKFNPNVYFYPMKLTDTNIKVMEQRLEKNNEYTNLSIDVFPIDSFPKGKVRQKIYKLKFYYYKMLIGFCNVDILRTNVKRKNYEKVLIKFAKIFKLNKILKLNKIRGKFDRFLKKYKIENCELIGDITGAYGFKEFVPKEYFEEGKKVSFEDIKVIAPKKAEDYLTHIYGDYMKLPPEEKRVAGHIKLIEE
ncbi:MAG: LicD family protein, partial [Clostridia bacterium]|nr:LicD family protein [Clostridia bacterium]